MENLLSIKNLKVQYPFFCLDEISFDINCGEIVGLIGENGAGKSTTIKAIMGMVNRQGGTIQYCGKQIKEKDLPEFRQHTGYVGDAELYYAKIKVKQLLQFLSELYAHWNHEKMNRYLELFHLDKEKKMIELSIGMRVKLEILMALCHDAQIYLLDEPTSGIDPVARNEILQILKEIKQEGKGILFSTHITTDLEKIADRLIYLVDGRIVVDETMEKIKEKYGSAEEVLYRWY